MNEKQRNRIGVKISRILLMICAMALVVVASVGGTIAWLTDVTDPVTNTFTAADIEISLTETPNADSEDEDTENDIWTAQIIPGKEYSKDPKVTVDGDKTSVDIYLYVQAIETGNPGTYLDYTYEMNVVGSGWKPVSGVNNVWYREVADDATELTWDLLVDDKVTVKTGVTKDVAKAANAKIEFKAYAIQKEGFTAENGWKELNPGS